MEFIPLILAVVLFVPMIYLILSILWIGYALVAIVMNGPVKGVEIIRSW